MWWVHPSLQLYPVISLHTFEGSIRSAVPVGSRTSTLPGVEKNAGDSLVFVTYGNWKGLITDANECRGRWKRVVRYYSVFFQVQWQNVIESLTFSKFWLYLQNRLCWPACLSWNCLSSPLSCRESTGEKRQPSQSKATANRHPADVLPWKDFIAQIPQVLVHSIVLIHLLTKFQTCSDMALDLIFQNHSFHIFQC